MTPVLYDLGLPGPLARWAVWLRMRRDRLEFIESVVSRGEFVRLPIGAWNTFWITNLEYIKEVLVTQAKKVKKGIGLERSRRVLGDGLLTSEGEAHRRQRRLVQPAFHKQRLQSYGEAMVDITARYRDELRDGEDRDLHIEMMRLTLNIVGKTLFDSDVEGDAADIGRGLSEFFKSLNFMLLPGFERLSRLPLPQMRRIRESRATLDRIIYRLIAERRASGGDRGDLLSMLVAATDTEEGGGAAGTGMTDEQLRDELLTLLLAGHETTANAITWTIFLLSQHPAVEERLLSEIDRALGGRLPTVEDLPALAYVEQVVAESMRLYPPAHLLARRALEPVQFDDYVIETGSMIFIPIRVLHRQERYFPEPLSFNPDRFAPEARAAIPRYAYMPFSHGPRNCIGENFAWMEAVLVLTTLMQRFQFRLQPGQKVEPEPLMTLRPRYGMHMRICARAPRR